MSEGRKDDGGKAPWHLLPPDALNEIVLVLEFGARKYGDRNWERGMAWSRPFSALMRHMWAWWRGEDFDPETGYSHLAHAACCILFLMTYRGRATGVDDRPISCTASDDDPTGRHGGCNPATPAPVRAASVWPITPEEEEERVLQQP